MMNVQTHLRVPVRALVYAANDAYAPLAGISLLSYLKYNSDVKGLLVVILNDGISEKNKEHIRQIAEERHCEILFRDVRSVLQNLAERNVTGYANAKDRGLTAYGRIFLESFLPASVTRVVYLDCDTAVAGDMSSLWTFDLRGNPVGFACDCLRNEYKKVIAYPQDERYFNSGVMLIDLPAWREKGCLSKILHHIQNVRTDYPLVDQDVMNLALRGQITALPPRYNFLSQLFLYEYASYRTVYHLWEKNWCTPEEFLEAHNHPLIYHFCGQTFGRPWFSNSRHPVKQEYRRYIEQSPWQGMFEEKIRLPIPYLIQYWSYRFLPEAIAAYLNAWIQRIFLWIVYRVSS